MVRLLHTADVHLGAKFTTLGEKGREQREQIRTTFKKLVSLARDEKVDILLIAGDLFDSNLVAQKDIQLVKEQFDLLAKDNINVCIIPGTHDCFDQDSVYRKVDFQSLCPNVVVFAGEGWLIKAFPQLNLTIHGRPNISNRSYESPLEGLQPLTSSRFHVAMAHGSLDIGSVNRDDHVFTIEQLRNSGMNYIALGHWHRAYPCLEKGVTAWYSGSPELISLDQKEPGQCLLVTILDSGDTKVERRQVGCRRYDEVTVDFSSVNDLSELKNRISHGADPNLVRRVTLKGARVGDIDPEELTADLQDLFFHLKIDDQSYTRLPEDQYEDRLIVASFARLMKNYIENCQDKLEKKNAEEALQLGLALLEGKKAL